MPNRLTAIRGLLRTRQADGLLVSAGPDVRWASGFSGSNGWLIVTRRRAVLLTDPRYTEQAARQALPGITVVITRRGLRPALAGLRLTGSLLYQADRMPAAELAALRRAVPVLRFRSGAGLLAPLVACKDASELRLIRRALRISEQVFEEILPLVKPGVRERELQAEIVYRQLRAGADGVPEDFLPIVASGANSALPHATATAKRIRHGELVLFDFGCTVGGYASDLTRMVAVGEPGAEARRVQAAVAAAQQVAIATIRAERPAAAAVAAARAVLAQADYERYFPHGLGHGVGLRIHEWPRLSPLAPAVLPTGTVLAIEPGVYLPRKFGVRLENMVVVEPDRCRSLNRLSTDLVVL